MGVEEGKERKDVQVFWSKVNGDANTEIGQNEVKAELRKEFKFGSGHVILRCLLVNWAVE